MGELAVAARQPAHLWIPPRLGSYGDEAVDLMKLAGRTPDAEQALTIDAMLSYKAGGKVAALESAVVKVRQNGKTAVDMTAIALYRAFCTSPDRVIWTAHLFNTCRATFLDHVQLIEGCSWLSSKIKKIYTSNGKEEIILKSGASLVYLARSNASGRGFGSGTLLLDEALFLSADMMQAVFPTLSARPDPMVVYGSSPGIDRSDHLRAVRDRGRASNDPSLVYVEYCAPGSFREPSCENGSRCTHEVRDRAGLSAGCAFDNVEYRLAANPAAPQRISLDYIESERRAMPSYGFGVERMGWWDDPVEGNDAVLPVESWRRQTDRDSRVEEDGLLAVAFDCSPGLGTAYVAVAGTRTDGNVHVEVIKGGRGVSWLPAYLEGLADRLDLENIHCMPTEHNDALIARLPEHMRDEVVQVMTRAEVPAACTQFVALVDPSLAQFSGIGMDFDEDDSLLGQVEDLRLYHLGDPILEEALKSCSRRQVGDGGWVPSRANSVGDIAPLCAVIAGVRALMLMSDELTIGAMTL